MTLLNLRWFKQHLLARSGFSLSSHRASCFATIALSAYFILGLSQSVFAQIAAPAKPARPGAQAPKSAIAPTTIIEVELLADDGVLAKSQEWQEIFQRYDVAVRIRRPTKTEKIETREEPLGRSRRVVVVGVLEKGGQLRFSDRSFRAGDVAGLGDWLKELQTYGAQGTPEDQPMWGLSMEQFTEVYESLSTKVSAEVTGLALPQALSKLGLPENLRLEPNSPATEVLSMQEAPLVARVRPFTKATALAMVLREAGLGWRPARNPAGRLELKVVPLSSDDDDVWPIGWPLKRQRQDAAPAFFETQSLRFDPQPLPDLVNKLEAASGLPFVWDTWRIGLLQMDPAKNEVKFAPKKSMLSIVANQALVSSGYSRDIVQDEAGTPFVWITPLKNRTRKN